MPHTTTQLSLTGVGITLDHHPVLTDVTTAVTPGTTTGVIGENGSGGLAHLAQHVPFRQDVTVAGVIDADVRGRRACTARGSRGWPMPAWWAPSRAGSRCGCTWPRCWPRTRRCCCQPSPDRRFRARWRGEVRQLAAARAGRTAG